MTPGEEQALYAAGFKDVPPFVFTGPPGLLNRAAVSERVWVGGVEYLYRMPSHTLIRADAAEFLSNRLTKKGIALPHVKINHESLIDFVAGATTGALLAALILA